MEIGPYRLKDENTLVLNDGSWHEFANLLFVDNPVGTGFSYVDTDSYVHELDEMADQFIVFLEKWFSLFPEYEHDDVRKIPSETQLPVAHYHCRYILPENRMQDNTFLISRSTSSNGTSSLVPSTSGL